MFIKQEELKSVIYEYQLGEIVESDPEIVEMAISAAVEEMISYLSPRRNSTTRYDTAAIFSATGTNRNALILELCKNIALYYICRLSNVDIIADKIQERYDRAIKWLERVSSPDGLVPGLPTVADDGNVSSLPFRSSSREKFNHE